jgi:D-tagatose-1,6-bisphosphate aldolase subunit GatZ/KbaZ
MKYFIGPMSKNVVDSVIEYNSSEIGFIPSRRQVDYNGGYVYNWTTGEFATYVNGRVPIERDHGGVGQGYKYDNGMESFTHDSKYFDIIHIDPWKKYDNLHEGLQKTVDYINFIYNINNKIKFEVGTEESIRRFELHEIRLLLSLLERNLKPKVFDNIEYVVVQSGVGLDLGKQVNTGNFDGDRLREMVGFCKAYGKKTKEHNGDYLTSDEYKDRFDLGLDSINIAPEFGQLETLCYLDEMGDDIEDYYQICYDSQRWEKWVDYDFVPEHNKKELIKICGHYVFSDKTFLDIKPSIDNEIKKVITNKLKGLV